MRFAFIAKHRHIWPVSWLCDVLEVSRSGFHAWLNRPSSERAIHDAKFVTAIDKSFKASDRTYGARRVWRDVLEDGLACGLHRVERLMRQNALRARPKRRGKPKDDGERSVIADNILDRDFQADRPNQKWLADFTYIWTAEGWLYVAVVLDLFSRRAVGWSMKSNRDASLVMDALMMAVWRRGKADDLLHHSDQGSQYTSEQFQRLLKDHGITCSMSRAGNVWDNSAMESFFSSLKTERTARKVYRTRDEAKADVFDYIERFYNFSSQRTSRYVIEGSRVCCAGSGPAGCLEPTLARERTFWAAGPSISSRLKSHGPSANGCMAVISPRSAAKRNVFGATPTMDAARVRLSHGSAPSIALR
jgi:putative transposase